MNQHLKILSYRFTNIGRSNEEPLSKLHQSISDFGQISYILKVLRESFSPILFFMFFQCIFSFVLYIIILLKIEDLSVSEKIIGLTTSAIMLSEMSLTCYFGTELQDLFYNFHTVIYSCLWYNQSLTFQKDLKVFMEMSLYKKELSAGGFFPVNLNTFLKLLNQSYTLFMLILNVLK